MDRSYFREAITHFTEDGDTILFNSSNTTGKSTRSCMHISLGNRISLRESMHTKESESGVSERRDTMAAGAPMLMCSSLPISMRCAIGNSSPKTWTAMRSWKSMTIGRSNAPIRHLFCSTSSNEARETCSRAFSCDRYTCGRTKNESSPISR